ncbi:methyltransferase [Mycobacterium sp. 852013-50091_SCH5140682]|uniref:class I SAM-dependent methyltransferase n=1 Tax=Mycobacterium sp. 852013-50091_SCH5140682 TaxID=1834109 RepID=UPI0007EBE2D7|nr:class I SAM-dependent methyltransferase [Mycobacterium sp. 852013-50091_SCH5140682]OBC10285.1 methyltransferase [Mycobacterium sp. 852013-50091_SCH5140682]
MATKMHVDLSGPPQTMLDMVYAKALDADSARPVLGDRFAKQLMTQLDYDWSKSPVPRQRRRQVTSIAVRAAQFDIWVQQFLAVTERPVVLHVGCGLDSRAFRVDPGPDVEWYDIDFPDVIALRERLYPARQNYHLVSSSATDPNWLNSIPKDRPALLIAEGVSMYLTERDGIDLLRRVVSRFPSGELQLDFWSRFGRRAQAKNNKVVRWSGSDLGWAVNSPDEIIGQIPRVRSLRAISVFEAGTVALLPKGYRRFAAAAARTPGLRDIVQFHRYAF